MCIRDRQRSMGNDKRFDVFFRSPSSAAVFCIPPKLLSVLAFEIDQQPETNCAYNTDKPIQRDKACLLYTSKELHAGQIAHQGNDFGAGLVRLFAMGFNRGNEMCIRDRSRKKHNYQCYS